MMTQIKQLKKLLQNRFITVIFCFAMLTLSYLLFYVDIFDLDIFNRKYAKVLETELLEWKQKYLEATEVQIDANDNTSSVQEEQEIDKITLQDLLVGALLLIGVGLGIYFYFHTGGDAPTTLPPIYEEGGKLADGNSNLAPEHLSHLIQQRMANAPVEDICRHLDPNPPGTYNTQFIRPPAGWMKW